MADATGTQASRLHECEARKGPRDVESEGFDAAEATALQAGRLRSSPLAFSQ